MSRTSLHAWPAHYAGTCGSCEAKFAVGTMVRYDQGRVVEDVCEAKAIERAAAMGPQARKVYREQMCVRCFTVHAPGQEGCQ